MTRVSQVLVLGGTGWLSGRVVQRWLDTGASVTCLSRGRRPVPYGARAIVADREEPGAYDDVRAHEWDEVVEISSRADHVRAAVAALTGVARHVTYVSSVSVYADNDTPGADEDVVRAEPAAPGDAYDYAREKAAAEDAVRAALAHRAAIVRPGLIVGPGDPTDRFGYWVARFALAGDEPVLVPGAAPEAPELRTQVIDVDDLAEFIVALGREHFTGAVNAVGDVLPLSAVLSAAAEVAGHTGKRVTAASDLLRRQDVEYWAGPRSLPLWLPDDMPGFGARSNARYRLLGGRLRPLRETLARVLADERSRGLDRERAAGLSRVDELALIAELARG